MPHVQPETTLPQPDTTDHMPQPDITDHMPPPDTTDHMPQPDTTDHMPQPDTSDPMPQPNTSDPMPPFNGTAPTVDTEPENGLTLGMGPGVITALVIISLILVAGITIGLFVLARQRSQHKEEPVKQDALGNENKLVYYDLSC